MRSTIAGKLTGDMTLMALLTGGVHTATEISRQNTTAAFDTNGELKPCALVKVESEGPSGPYLTSGRLFFVVYVYERVGQTTIDAALDRVFVLLNMWKPTALGTALNVWEVRHAGDVRDVGDQALECSMGYGRYVATRLR